MKFITIALIVSSMSFTVSVSAKNYLKDLSATNCGTTIGGNSTTSVYAKSVLSVATGKSKSTVDIGSIRCSKIKGNVTTSVYAKNVLSVATDNSQSRVSIGSKR